MIKDKSLLEKIIALRQKYKEELDRLPTSSMNSVRRKMTKQIVVELTDILYVEPEPEPEQEGAVDEQE